jgi:hypothetical protein
VARPFSRRLRLPLVAKGDPMLNKEYVLNFQEGVCDKCGHSVVKSNSALLLNDLVTRSVRMGKDRHLYPTANCEGSPSRVTLVNTNNDVRMAYNLMQVVGN